MRYKVSKVIPDHWVDENIEGKPCRNAELVGGEWFVNVRSIKSFIDKYGPCIVLPPNCISVPGAITPSKYWQIVMYNGYVE